MAIYHSGESRRSGSMEREKVVENINRNLQTSWQPLMIPTSPPHILSILYFLVSPITEINASSLHFPSDNKKILFYPFLKFFDTENDLLLVVENQQFTFNWSEMFSLLSLLFFFLQISFSFRNPNLVDLLVEFSDFWFSKFNAIGISFLPFTFFI